MASKRGQRRKSCTGKKRYGTREEALGQAAALQRKDHYPMRAYPCRWCGGYHVGHMPRKDIRAMSRKRGEGD